MRCNAGPVTDTNFLVDQESREARNLRVVTRSCTVQCDIIEKEESHVDYNVDNHLIYNSTVGHTDQTHEFVIYPMLYYDTFHQKSWYYKWGHIIIIGFTTHNRDRT